MFDAIKSWFKPSEEPQRTQNPDTSRAAAFLNKQGAVILPPENPAAAKLHDVAEKLLFDAVHRRASELTMGISAKDANAVVEFTIDGVAMRAAKFPRDSAATIAALLKRYAGLDEREHRRPQSGKLSIKAMGQIHPATLRTAGSREGESLVISIGTDAELQLALDELGLLPAQLELLREARQRPIGCVLVGGSPGHGASTTLLALARDHDAFTQNIVMIERKQRIELDVIKQIEVAQDTNQQSIHGEIVDQIAEDADVLLIDPIDCPETALSMCGGCGEAKKCYGVLPRSSVWSVLAQWRQWIDNDRKAGEHLQAITAQRRLRRLCPSCKEAYKPEADKLAKLNLPADKLKKLYRPPTTRRKDAEGRPIVCDTCQGTGFFGQLALFEVWVLDDEARQLIASGASDRELQSVARRNKLYTIQEVGLRRVAEGTTSLQELIRVTKG